MGFWIDLVQTTVVAVFIVAVACGGVLCGKNLRMRKNAKIAQETVTAQDAE
ncbi:MAG: hypothetical protein R3Y40_06325 [Eubacteriales bacterium]